MILTELKQSLRGLLARPGFALAVVLILALGVGANTAVFSVLQGWLLRPLAYPDSERLVVIDNTYPKMGVSAAGTTVADYLDRRAQADALVDSAVYYSYSVDLTNQGDAERITGVVATPSLFSTLGVSARIGRTFLAEDAEPDGDRSVMWVPAQAVVLLSDALWRSAFAADPDVVGRELRLSGRSHRVIGVMPPGFAFPNRETRLWLPFAFSDRQRSDAMRGFEFAQSVGRLAPTATVAQLNAQFDQIAARNLERASAGSGFAETAFWQRAASAGFSARARSLHEHLLGDTKPTLWLLQAAAGLVLLLACANVATLLLIRLAARRRELAVRLALGASTRRVASQLALEHALLVAVGGAVGMLFALAMISLIRAMGLDGAARGFSIGLDLPVLGLALGAMLLTAASCCLLPLFFMRDQRPSSGLYEGGRGSVGGRRARSTRHALVVVQVGLAVALLVGTGLLGHSYWRVQQLGPGFSADQLISVNFNLSRNRYVDPADTRRFQDEVLAAASALPGVESVGLISGLPFSDDKDSTTYVVAGREQQEPASAYLQTVGAGLFRTMGIALLQGRDFTVGDDAKATPVVIIDEALARREFGDGNPLGQQLATPGVNGLEWRTIVGVVASVKRHRLSETVNPATYYVPMRQSTTRIFRLVMRSLADVEALAGPLRAAVAKIDPQQPIWDLMRMQDRIDRSLDERRAPLLLLLAFAGIAVALCTVGIHGVLAFAVARRSGEIGVRMALGAAPFAILRMVLGEGGRLVASGVLLGMPLAAALALLLRAQVFGVGMVDPLSLAFVAIAVAGMGLLASLLPAWRAARISPMEALRAE